MNVSEAISLARELMDEFGLDEWHVEIDTRPKQRLGQTRFGTKAIGLSRVYVELNERAVIENTIRHEIAHALVGPGHGHDRVWKRMCLTTGAIPEVGATAAMAVQPPKRWTLSCPTCDFTTGRHKRTQGAYTHHPRHGVLVWSDNRIASV